MGPPAGFRRAGGLFEVRVIDRHRHPRYRVVQGTGRKKFRAFTGEPTAETLVAMYLPPYDPARPFQRSCKDGHLGATGLLRGLAPVCHGHQAGISYVVDFAHQESPH